MQTVTQNKIEIARLQNNILQVRLGDFVLRQNIEEPLAEVRALLTPKTARVDFEAENLQNWDSSLLLFIYEIKRICAKNKILCNLNNLPQNLQDLISLAFAVDIKPSQAAADELSAVEKTGRFALNIWGKICNTLDFICSVGGGVWRCLTFRSVMRRVDFCSALEDCGPKAVGIVCLVSFLIGLILAFVGAVQLQTFGAQIYVASLVTIGMCRIMGAIMVGVIMAGRTGSSYAATIGTMQVNEELDALQTMGLSRIDFLVMPRLLAMLIAMPILTMIADFLGMLGGAFVGVLIMDLPYQKYWEYAFNSFHLNNFSVGVFHGFCFAFIISLCGCYSGLKCGRNADSVGKATTQSVVSAIVWMIVVTGIITIICQELRI